jgi:hypothetical protein
LTFDKLSKIYRLGFTNKDKILKCFNLEEYMWCTSTKNIFLVVIFLGDPMGDAGPEFEPWTSQGVLTTQLRPQPGKWLSFFLHRRLSVTTIRTNRVV